MDSKIYQELNLVKNKNFDENEKVNIPIMESLPMPQNKNKEKINKYQNIDKSFGTLEEIAFSKIIPYDSRFTGIPE